MVAGISIHPVNDRSVVSVSGKTRGTRDMRRSGIARTRGVRGGGRNVPCTVVYAAHARLAHASRLVVRRPRWAGCGRQIVHMSVPNAYIARTLALPHVYRMCIWSLWMGVGVCEIPSRTGQRGTARVQHSGE